MGLIKGAASVLLALVLALAWAWTGWLKDAGRLNDKQRLWILVALTVLLGIQQIYLVLPKPEKRSSVEERRAINQHFLTLFCNKYYGVVTAGPPIRANIMLPTRKVKGLLGSYLQIYYYAVPPGLPYNDAELSARWKAKEGTCGWAWKCKVMSIFDSAIPALKLSDKRVNPSKAGIVGHIHSALSVPIWHGGRVVGVFSLDSDHNVAETLFDNPDVYTLAAGFAQNLAAQCYQDGVEA